MVGYTDTFCEVKHFHSQFILAKLVVIAGGHGLMSGNCMSPTAMKGPVAGYRSVTMFVFVLI